MQMVMSHQPQRAVASTHGRGVLERISVFHRLQVVAVNSGAIAGGQIQALLGSVTKAAPWVTPGSGFVVVAGLITLHPSLSGKVLLHHPA